MANSNNTVTLQGFLGQAPEFKELSESKCVANASIAIKDIFSKEEKTNWFRLVFWNKKAVEAKDSLDKGTLVRIKGRLSTNTFEKDGTNITLVEIIVGSFEIVEKEGE